MATVCWRPFRNSILKGYLSKNVYLCPKKWNLNWPKYIIIGFLKNFFYCCCDIFFFLYIYIFYLSIKVLLHKCLYRNAVLLSWAMVSNADNVPGLSEVNHKRPSLAVMFFSNLLPTKSPICRIWKSLFWCLLIVVFCKQTTNKMYLVSLCVKETFNSLIWHFL